jgi:hypothetical protein
MKGFVLTLIGLAFVGVVGLAMTGAAAIIALIQHAQ